MVLVLEDEEPRGIDDLYGLGQAGLNSRYSQPPPHRDLEVLENQFHRKAAPENDHACPGRKNKDDHLIITRSEAVSKGLSTVGADTQLVHIEFYERLGRPSSASFIPANGNACSHLRRHLRHKGTPPTSGEQSTARVSNKEGRL